MKKPPDLMMGLAAFCLCFPPPHVFMDKVGFWRQLSMKMAIPMDKQMLW